MLRWLITSPKRRLKPALGMRNTLTRIVYLTRFNGSVLPNLDFNRGRRSSIPFLFLIFHLLLFSILLPACLPQGTLPIPTATISSTLVPVDGQTSVAGEDDPAILTPTSSPFPLFTLTPPPTETPDASQADALFPLTIPISLPLTTSIPIDPSYRFASTQSGNREPHHGVEFLLPFGSPVLAAADGAVLFAGDDNNGSPYTPPNNYAFYGNFIIVEHTLPNYQLPITNYQISNTHFYTLYAHLSEIKVQTGDQVRTGDEIGLIGFSGAALGPHLHFEVRLDGLTYADSHNPELFLDQPGLGVLVGRILDANGHPIPPTALTLTPINPAGRSIYLTTYEDPALALRPPFHENFALTLAPGQYELAFVLYGIHNQTLEIQPGKLTFFDITVGEQ